MRKAEIDALVRAHGGRARPVAFFHVLRQRRLDPDDHAFLLEYADELGASDLLRWRSRCEAGKTGPLIRLLARRAVHDPGAFKHEVLDLPRIELSDAEWRELGDLVRGHVPPAIYEGILARGGPRPVRPPPEFYFTPGVLDRSGLDLDVESAIDAGPDAAPLHARSLRRILHARASGELSIDEAALLELAMERARTSDEDWSRAAIQIPASLCAAVLERARRTPRGAERANLLEWLDRQGVPRATLLPVALAPLAEQDGWSGVVAWLSRELSTRAAWDRHGLATISALMQERAFPEIGELIAQVCSEAARGGEKKAKALLEAIHAAFALALVEITRRALENGERARAAAALSALACLDPPSRASRAVHELRAAAALDEDLAELLSVNERLLKHTDARDATLEGVIAALHAIADAFGCDWRRG
jgi:hypothetical protein